MKKITERVPSILKMIKTAQALDNSTKDKYSGMFLLQNIPNKMWVKGDGLVGNKALATRYSYEAAKKHKQDLNLDLAIVDEHTEEVINDSVNDSDMIDYLIIQEKKAIEDYDKALAMPELSAYHDVLSHIKSEEEHHIEELEELKVLINR